MGDCLTKPGQCTSSEPDSSSESTVPSKEFIFAQVDKEAGHLNEILWREAEDGNWTGIKQAITMGANAASTNQEGDTLLHFFVRRGNTKMVCCSLTLGIEVNSWNGEEKTPFIVGCELLTSAYNAVISGLGCESTHKSECLACSLPPIDFKSGAGAELQEMIRIIHILLLAGQLHT